MKQDMQRLLTTGLLASLLVLGGLANAQTVVFEGDIPPSLMQNGQPVGGATGTYHVVISLVSGTTYEVVVTGNPDGNVQDAAVGTASPLPNPPVPKAGVRNIAFNFYDEFNNPIAVDVLNPGSGGSTSYVGPGPGIGVMNNVGGNFNELWGTNGGAWTWAGGLASVVFDTDAYDARTSSWLSAIAPHGGNEFRGTFTLQSNASYAVASAFQGAGQQWSGRLTLIPEGSSLAMLLPGLFPLGYALRRRRR